jgi:formate C-acetyltransferase
MRAFSRMGGMTLQLNCVSVDQLREAQSHPDRHHDLTVRISGLSARFVALTREVQDEIIDRMVMRV